MAAMLENLRLFGPETALIAGLMALFLTDAFTPKIRGTVFQMILVVATCVAGALLTCSISNEVKPFFSGLVANDGFSQFFRYLFFFACAVGAYIAHGSRELPLKGRSEFYLLLVCTTIGMSLMAISTNLLLLYIGIETVSIVSFVMAGFSRDDRKSNEASFKYLVFGALASGLMIYGFSLLYGITGSLNYAEIAKALAANTNGQPFITVLAFLMVYGGLAYKISSFPMHFWTPDVYEGSPVPVATFFSVGPKAAGFAAILRLFYTAFSTKTGVGAEIVFAPIAGLPVVQLLIFVSAATMLIGNLSAIAQTSVKRILAFSSVAHVGYLLMGMLTLNSAGTAAILFYLAVYCIMNMGAFWVVGIVVDVRGNDNIHSFKGIGWKMPVLGTCMAVFLFSLTGIPLFSGFIGKFMLFGAVVQSGNYLWLALLGVLNSVVSLYYYAKILKSMWLDAPSDTLEEGLSLYHGVGLVALAAPTIIFGLFFTPILNFVAKTLTLFS